MKVKKLLNVADKLVSFIIDNFPDPSDLSGDENAKLHNEMRIFLTSPEYIKDDAIYFMKDLNEYTYPIYLLESLLRDGMMKHNNSNWDILSARYYTFIRYSWKSPGVAYKLYHDSRTP